MALAALVFGMIFALAPAGALPVTGTLTVDGQPFAFQDAVAYRTVDWDGPKVVVVLLQQPLDHDALGRTLDVQGAVEAAKESGSWVQLDYGQDGSWTKARHQVRSEHGSSGGSKYDGALAPAMKAQIAGGRVTGPVKADFGGGYVIDLTLALTVTEPAAGTALPADGGAPGAALRGCNGAFAKHDMTGLQRFCSTLLGEIVASAIRAKAADAQADDPWTRGAAGECEAAAVTDLTADAGVTAGDEARIPASGQWDEEHRCVGNVFLRRENGAWRVSASQLLRVDK